MSKDFIFQPIKTCQWRSKPSVISPKRAQKFSSRYDYKNHVKVCPHALTALLDWPRFNKSSHTKRNYIILTLKIHTHTPTLSESDKQIYFFCYLPVNINARYLYTTCWMKRLIAGSSSLESECSNCYVRGMSCGGIFWIFSLSLSLSLSLCLSLCVDFVFAIYIYIYIYIYIDRPIGLMGSAMTREIGVQSSVESYQRLKK